MKKVWTILGALGFISGAAFLAFSILAWTGLVPPGEPLTASLGLTLLIVGIFTLREAANKTAERGTWKRSNVKVGRLSALGFGLGFCTVGIAFLGSDHLPKQFAYWVVGAFAVAFALAWVGQSLDARRARARGELGQIGERAGEENGRRENR